jgi:hypothetical protein
METVTCDVPLEKIRSYVKEPEDARSLIPVPDQILNVDETGFCSRPMKAKKKTIVYAKRCTRKAACTEESAFNHMSLVATLNLFGEHLKPFYLITNKVANKDADLQLLATNVALSQTPKGYENSYSMDFDVCKMLVLYCDNLRNAIHDPTPPICLIVDNCPSHKK